MTYGFDSTSTELSVLRRELAELRRVMDDGVLRLDNRLDRLQHAAESDGRDRHDLTYRVGSVEEQIVVVNRRITSVECRLKRLEGRVDRLEVAARSRAPSQEASEPTETK